MPTPTLQAGRHSRCPTRSDGRTSMGDTRTGSRTNLLHAPSGQKDRPPPFVTVTLHPFFSGQTEKPGELRGRWKSVATPRPQGEPSIPHAPSGTEGETAGRKKREGLPSPLMPPARRPTHRLSNSAWSSGLTYICCSPTCCPSRQVHGIIVARSSRASIRPRDSRSSSSPASAKASMPRSK